MSYSVKQQLAGARILLTGATGYVGSLVLESLLRTTDVAAVTLLLRPGSNGVSSSDRAQKLVSGSLFHKVRDCKQLTDKVQAVPGDLHQPQLGLDPKHYTSLCSGTDIIIHCAADIRLELDIQASLRANYRGTEEVLQLARQCPKLRAIVYVSSAYVNMHLPLHSTVDECLYPLCYGSQPVDTAALVQELLQLPAAAAQDRAAALTARWGFPNNYTLGKHLTEHLVAAYKAQHHLPVAIVRPSLVSAVACEPLPGYIGNWAGPIGASAAMSIGLYHGLGCVSAQPLHVWDTIPGDLVASVVLAAAAAIAAGADSAIAAAGREQRAAAAAQLPAQQSASPAQPATAPHTAAGGATAPLIVHAASSSTYPLTLMEGWNHGVEFMVQFPPKFSISRGLLPRMTPGFRPDPAAVARERRWTGIKVMLMCSLLRMLGQRRAAQRLSNAFQMLNVIGTNKLDKDLTFSTHNLVLLEEGLPPEERCQHPLVWRPPTAHSTAAGAAGANGAATACNGTAAAAAAAGAEGGGGVVPAGPSHNTLTWRRFNHTLMAAVYSALFKVKVPQLAGSNAGDIQHDYRFVK